MTGAGVDIFVSTAPGLEGVTAGEVEALGHGPVEREPGGLSLQGDSAALWDLNLNLRTASRVLVRLSTFKASGFPELERKLGQVPWERIFPGALPEGVGAGGVEVEVTSRKSRLYHTGAVEERVRRVLEGWMKGRPVASPPPGIPGPRLVVRLLRDRVTLSADASGENLHRRGYRQAVARAPLRETLAAALLLASGWKGETPLMDPFCGSGTLVIEGALLALGIPPGLRRRFAFEGWPDVDPQEGDDLRRAAGEGLQGGPDLPVLQGSDRDAGAVRAAEANGERAGVARHVTFLQAPLSRAPFPGTPGLLVTNPPYGHRVGDTDRLKNLYSRLGTLLRERWPGGRAVILSPDRGLAGQLGMEGRVLFRTSNGGIPVEAVEFTGF